MDPAAPSGQFSGQRPSASTSGRAGGWRAKALGLAADAWRVFPLQPNGRRPLTQHGFLDATTDLSTVERWWRTHPEANVGVATGGGFTAIDLDVKNGVDGEATWARLRAAHGDVPITRTVVTPSGGRHLYFLTPDLTIHSSVGRLGPGIDVRSDGGYVVGAGVIDGVAYTTLPHPMAPAPDWLVELLLASDQETRAGRSPSDWGALARHGVGIGQRNVAVASLAGHLLRKGVHVGVVIELLCAWSDARCTPPLSRAEVVRCVQSIAGRELRRQGVVQ